MGIGNLIAKAKDMVAKNKDTAMGGVEKAGDMIDEKTEGKHSDRIDQAEDAAKGFIEDLREEN